MAAAWRLWCGRAYLPPAGAHELRAVRAGAQTVQKFVDDIKQGGGSVELFIYPGEGHAFMARPGCPDILPSCKFVCLRTRSVSA